MTKQKRAKKEVELKPVANRNIAKIEPHRMPLLDRKVPPRYIKELRSMGLTISRWRNAVISDPIEVGSEFWTRLMEMVQSLPPTRVKIIPTLSCPNQLYRPSVPRPLGFYEELRQYLPTLNPSDPQSSKGSLFGDASWIIQAAVRALEDPPASCPSARALPPGHFVLSLRVQFFNLVFRVPVFRKFNETTD